ncbi:hypothetical protein CBF16_14490 [Pantoea agglomerans]|uniref:hypothetical protein n=1 Tax=Enterobacter agglomerans TaxID=549 RepID=UPI000F5ED6DC|nr:hypothetical protein [Pantoea agglomerans]AZI52001.1 hypothetical protein CBF16_14490 [Pantoea agglomerans]
MNQHADTAINGGSLMTLLSSLAGLATLDRVYMATAVAGAVIALFGYLDKRRTEKLKRQQIEEERLKIEEDRQNERVRLDLDRERAQAVLDYLKGSNDTPAMHKSPEVIQGINRVLDSAKD